MNKQPINSSMHKAAYGLLFLFLFPMGLSSAEVLSTDPQDVQSSQTAETSSAKIVDLEGDVRLLKEGSADWKAAEKDQSIEVGDQIMTGNSSYVDIAYDSYLLNITHIEENTKAEFRSINPTDIYLEDGSIFSALDGLEGEGQYQIATPTAVAGVRGTHFDVAFDENTQKFSAASLPTGDESHKSIIFVRDPKNSNAAPVEVIENKQFDLRFGEPIQMERLRAVEPQRMNRAQTAFQQMEKRMPQFQERRQEGKVQFQERKQMRQEGRNPNVNPEGKPRLEGGVPQDRLNPGERPQQGPMHPKEFQPNQQPQAIRENLEAMPGHPNKPMRPFPGGGPAPQQQGIQERPQPQQPPQGQPGGPQARPQQMQPQNNQGNANGGGRPQGPGPGAPRKK